MDISKRILIIILFVVSILGLIIYSEQIKPAAKFTKQEKQQIEHTHYSSVGTATQALMDAAAEGSNSYTFNPISKSKPTFYAVVASSPFDEEEENEYYTMAYIIKEPAGYKVKIRDRDIQLKKENSIIIDTYQIGNTKTQYYIGPEKDMPFKQDGAVLSAHSDMVIAFHRETKTK